ncbi:response regulator [Azospirillum agricola]|uniref:response regulator transcription factor n=1 Tax=Azospirillum agricola TaxID=1720247 RepID=UPI000A0F359B|nr:response regulator transcription factor [Azospirillum agricola]SMH47480.1 hypothetical protein SAMN02982994_2596 [Azospirillum lipoferum]
MLCGLTAADRPSTPRHAPGRGDGNASSAPLLLGVIDDRVLFGESLVKAINGSDSGLSAWHATSAQALADLRAVLGRADVVLVAIGRSGPSVGRIGRVIEALLAERPHPPVAVLTERMRPPLLEEGRRSGLSGVLSVAVSLAVLIDAIRRLHRGERLNLPDG